MDDYKFSLNKLEGDLVEIRIVMPSPLAQPTDLTGLDARKRIAKWILASAEGFARSCRATEETIKIFPVIYEAVVMGLDHEGKFRPLIRQEVGKREVSPEELLAQPPEGMTPRETEMALRVMLATKEVELDEQGKLRATAPTTH